MEQPANPGPLTRRDFVKASAVTAAALPFVGASLAVARSAHVAGSDTIKLGLIGCGGRGTGAAKQALIADKGNVLWSMGDVFQDRLDASHKNLSEQLAADAADGTDARKAYPEQMKVADDRKFV